MCFHLVPVGLCRPEPHPFGGRNTERGAVTVEAAFALLALVAVLIASIWCLGVLGAQLAVGESARAAARVAARGESPADVAAEAHRLVPEAEVHVVAAGGYLVVEVRRHITPPGLFARFGPITLSSTSTAAAEVLP